MPRGALGKRGLARLLLSLAIVCALAGCRVLRPLTAAVIPGANKYASDFSEAELRDKLDSFYTDFAGAVDAASSAALAATDDLALRQKIIQGKLRIVRDCRNAVSQRNPMAAFLDTWALCLQLPNYFEGDPQSDQLGGLKAGFLRTEQHLRGEILDLGKLFLSPDRLADTDRKLADFARQHPLSPNRELVQPSADANRGIPEFGWLLNLPLSPFRAMEGVNATAMSVHELNAVADRFTRNMKDLPQEAAWESELLLLRARGEMVSMLGQLDRQQTNLASSLVQARLTTMEIGAALAKADPIASSAERAAKAAQEAGAAWDDVLKTYTQMMLTLYPPKVEPSVSAAHEGRPFDIRDYARTAEGLSTAASEIRQVLIETQRLLQEKELAASLRDVGETANMTIDRARTSATGLVDHVVWRAVQLIALVLLSAVIYRPAASLLQRMTKA